MKISKTPFGQFEGSGVDLFTLENDHGMVVKITNYGGIVTSIVVPDKDGKLADVACGFETLDEYFSDAYKANSPYFGCIVGRYAARVKDGKFTVDGQEYSVDTNDGPNHLHGGINALDKRVWSAETSEAGDGVSLKLSITSPDGDNGYPGNLTVDVTYTLTNDNELAIDYAAVTDKATPLSLTNHTYFNLSGFQDKVLNHQASIAADKFLVPDETNVPVGDEKQVAGSVWDYNQSRPIGDAFAEEPKGFETYYVFSKSLGAFEKVASFADPVSGRTLEISSSEPGMLFYTGFYTSDELKRSDDVRFGQFRGFCCETSKYPNGPNIAGAPNSVLEAGAKYSERTVFRFGTKAQLA
ncbi:aldose epimerase family protein [Haloferula chungangensis]|uniref:Aldose 1-epimerase n=1 Tax=Haloferula chungangensis TaxID=1048331 RepID=A0ABW2LDH5_9BACT